MNISKMIKATSLTLLSGLAFAATVTPVSYASATNDSIRTVAKMDNTDSDSLQQISTGSAFKSTAADDVTNGITKSDGSVDYTAVKKEITTMSSDQLNQTKSQLIANDKKNLDSLKDAKTSAVSVNDVKQSLLDLNVSDVRTQFNDKKQSLIDSLNKSGLNADQKQKQLDELDQFIDGLNNLTQNQYTEYINDLSASKMDQLTSAANKIIANIPAAKQKLNDQISQLNKLSGQDLKDYFLKQAKLSEQQYLYAKENPSQTVTQDTRKGPIQTIVEDTLAGIAIGALITSSPIRLFFITMFFLVLIPLFTTLDVVGLILSVFSLFLLAPIVIIFLIAYEGLLSVVLLVVTRLYYLIFGAIGAIPGGPIGFAVGVAQALSGGKVVKDPTQTNPQFIKYSQTLDDGTTVDLARKIDIKKGHSYAIETQAFTQSSNLLQAPYPNSLQVGISSSATTMTNVTKDTIDNVKGDFNVTDGKIGTISFDAKKDGTVYLNAIAPSPLLQDVSNYKDLGANLNIWKVNVFMHDSLTQTSSNSTNSTNNATNSVDKKLVAGLDAQ